MGHVDVNTVTYTLPDGRVLLDDVSFRVGDDAKVALVGANGSGKTTLLRVIAGLEKQARGDIRFRDRIWLDGQAGVKPENRFIGYVFQDGGLFSHLDVRGNLQFPLRHGRRHGAIEFDEIVDALDLAELLDRDTITLSGGERQRVAIGRALLANPLLLLMDEPLSSVDRPRKRKLLEKIKALPKRFDLPIVYVTHDLDELLFLADSVVLLADGRNIAHGSPTEIIERSDFERLSQCDEPGAILEAAVVGHSGDMSTVRVGDQDLNIPLLEGASCEAIRLRIDPRDVIIAVEEPARISIRNRLKARIEAIEPRSHGQLTIRLSAGGQFFGARITTNAAEELELSEGQQVFALIKSVALDAFPMS